MRDKDRLKRLAEERWTHRLARRDKEYHPRATQHREAGPQGGYRSRILDLFSPFVPHRRRKRRPTEWFQVPTNFSLSHNPENTMVFYRELVAFARKTKMPRLLIDHREVEFLGLAADNVLGMILKEISWECRGQGGCSLRGWKADRPEARKMMERIGCIRAVTDDPTRKTEVDIDLDMQTKGDVFRYRNSKYISASGLVADGKARMMEDFADHLDACLDHVGKRLSAEGRSDLLEYLGEIVSNAEDHSRLNEWLVCGYVDAEESQLVYRCTVISFGETFASTFQNLPDDAEAKSEVRKYLEVHRRGGVFSKAWREEDLLAVVALQGDISCKNLDASSTRGQGTVDFLEFFSKISNSCSGDDVDATMALLTGRTLISFDGTYHIQEPSAGAPKVIAFNDENNLGKKPDSKAVRALKSQLFPGVVISIAAPLTSDMVEATYGPEREN